MGTRLDPWLRMAHGFVRSAAPNRVGYLLTSRAPSAKLCYPSLSRGGTVADYIQIVEYESDDIDAVIRTANSVPVPDDVPKPTSVIVVRDRDRPRTYATILRFNSYEDAMRHSESDATHERIAKLGPLMKGDTRFYNLDVLDETNP
jgi:hypothetical protein